METDTLKKKQAALGSHGKQMTHIHCRHSEPDTRSRNTVETLLAESFQASAAGIWGVLCRQHFIV
jgi:hypothetical protein